MRSRGQEVTEYLFHADDDDDDDDDDDGYLILLINYSYLFKTWIITYDPLIIKLGIIWVILKLN